MNINERLTRAISFVDKCACVVDVGSDHGYSSVYMIENKIADKVISTDISVPSLEKTVRLACECGLSHKIECRAGDGLKVLEKGEADIAFIAGMGAELIADIVEGSPEVARAMRCLVLQPMNSAGALRVRLAQMGYEILDEGIVCDNEKFYQIIKCRYTGQSTQLSQMECEVGCFVYKKRIPLCSEFIKYRIAHYANIVRYVGENETSIAKDRIGEAKAMIYELEEALKWADAQ